MVDGQTFYQATEQGFNLSMARFHAFSDVIRRHDELKLSDELLKTGLTTLTSLLKRIRSQAQQDTEQVLDAVGEGLVLVDRLEQRRTLGLTVEQVYEIASIWFFTETEDPGAVDSEMNRKKILMWLQHDQAKNFLSFFLRSPIGRYVPLASLSEASTLNYLKQVNELEILDWTRTCLLLKTNGENSATINTIESRTETLYGLDGLLSSVLSPTSISSVPGTGPNSEK